MLVLKKKKVHVLLINQVRKTPTAHSSHYSLPRKKRQYDEEEPTSREDDSKLAADEVLALLHGQEQQQQQQLVSIEEYNLATKSF